MPLDTCRIPVDASCGLVNDAHALALEGKQPAEILASLLETYGEDPEEHAAGGFDERRASDVTS